ncbi:hypothetical protein [Prosthecobacter sp.]|jgi:hypothetical protein|uniref:hypothetical protein n=1 Tax=Prosthecobacter sp. TaxID=1965333 RepID=UPI003783FA8C
MKPPSPTAVTPAESTSEDAGAKALLAWLPHLAKAQEIEDEPASFASPPCYLAQFADVDFADETAK